MKKIFCLLAVLLVLCVCFAACTPTNFKLTTSDKIKNVILIIGDGMGFNHIKNTKTYFGDDCFPFDDMYECEITTRSKSSSVTDSAAAATALATGTKVSNRSIGRSNGKDLETIMDVASSKGKKTGIVTNDNLFGATPSGFSSHAKDRSDTADIISGQATSGLDLMIGALDEDNLYANHANKFESNGYKLVNTQEELENTSSNQKVVATLNGLRSPYNETLNGQVGLTGVVEYALNYLDNKNGFCLMIEGAHIDKRSHSKDAYGAVCEVRMLADVIQTVLDFCSNRNDTAVLITADHETGGMQMATDKNNVDDDLYTRSGHSGANVPLYVKGFQLSEYDNVLDNTDVFKMCKKLITK